MGLSNQERINFNSKVLAAKVIDNNAVAQWYESKFPYSPNSISQRVPMDFGLILSNPASTLSEAQSNASGPLSDVLLDYTLPNQAKRLTNVIGTNNTTWVAKSVFGDLSSETIQDWIQPQSVDNSGNPSFGYGIKLYNGDPDSGGSEITTTDGQSGSGDEASVGWVWNYDLGLLFLSDDFKNTYSEFWVKGFVYNGNYLSDISFTGTTGSTVEGVTEVTTASYDVVNGDDNILVNFPGFSTINLPDSTLEGTVFTVNDMSGNATANTISVTTIGGSVLINGKNIDTINENYASATYLYYNGAYYIK